MTEISHRLRYLRDKRHLKRCVVSELCGLSAPMIKRYEDGDMEPTASVIVALADFYEVSTDYLLGRIDL